MASSARGRSHMRETSPERTKVWAEQQQRQRVPVVYYISRNGQLDHPHFMEVPISSHGGLFLRDVISRLNLLRGKGMATMYSWSSKRSYKNGFVWQDLSEDDFIHPAHGQEYVLKGSELLLLHSASVLIPGSQDTSTASSASSPSSDNKDGSFEMPKTCRDESDFNPARDATRIKKPTPPSWKSLDLNEYKVYKNELTAEASVRAAADASTQTDERRQRRRAQIAREEEERNHPCPEEEETTTNEVSPPPPSTPSPETLETLIRADRRLLPIPQEEEAAEVEYPSGRMRASAVLMHLISCGSISMKEHHDLPVPPPHYRRRLPPHPPVADVPSFPLIRMEDKEYFSGSLIETKKKASAGGGEIPALKRSSSYNADRGSKMEVAEEEIEGVRAKCIPRKPKSPAAARKEGSTHGSKRIEPTQTPQI